MPPAIKIPVGTRFGRLVTLSPPLNGKVKCLCDCGKTTTQRSYNLGRVVSCGCYNREKNRVPGAQSAWRQIHRTYKHSAKKRSLLFDLSIEQVIELCSGDCVYCGAAPTEYQGAQKNYLASAANKRTKEPDLAFAQTKVVQSNGIDRIDPNQGYIVDNCVSCCWDCNTAKLDRTLEDFKAWAIRLYNKFGSK